MGEHTTLRYLQDDLHHWMQAGGQTTNTRPTADLSDQDRVLRCRLLLEETLEFIEAMGCEVDKNGQGELAVFDLELTSPINLVEAADAIADVMVINLGNAITLGIDVQPVYDCVMTSNWAKFPNGEVTRDATGKITKPPGWQPPDIARVLSAQWVR